LAQQVAHTSIERKHDCFEKHSHVVLAMTFLFAVFEEKVCVWRREWSPAHAMPGYRF
jgi:hypothetical protein